eukprot:4276892-Prymnesium_polylepis.1
MQAAPAIASSCSTLVRLSWWSASPSTESGAVAAPISSTAARSAAHAVSESARARRSSTSSAGGARAARAVRNWEM